MNVVRNSKLLLASLLLALACRVIYSGVEILRQNALTRDLCGLVSLQLETGLLRETYEGLESALRARGEPETCVSVTDNGRSFAPDCFRPSKSYRTVVCKAQGNTGVRAAIAYESRGPFDNLLLLIWVASLVGLLLAVEALNFFANSITTHFSLEVGNLLTSVGEEWSDTDAHSSQVTRWILLRSGVASRIGEEAARFRAQLSQYEQSVARDTESRVLLQQQATASKRYQDKVLQIRHDIRSPFSSLQALYEKLKVGDAATTRALANAIRRIQVLMDDLDKVDESEENPKLIVVEVAIIEIASLMHEKFAELKSASLQVDFDRTSLSPALVGEKGFHSALENLLENAFDAISVEGRVAVRISTEGGFCKIEVEDDGLGVSEENLQNLFNEGASFGKLNGTGLGLFHTKQNVELWKGSIVCIPLERGSRFEITIPILQAGVVFSDLPENRSIKVIDDDEVVSLALERAGFKVLEFARDFETGAKVLASGTSGEFSILVDQHIGGGQLGTDLIGAQTGRKNVYLCTNDFDDMSVLKLAREIGVKIIPKPLCFLRPPPAYIGVRVHRAEPSGQI